LRGIGRYDGCVLPGGAHQAEASLPRGYPFQLELNAAAGQAVAVVVKYAERAARRHRLSHRAGGRS
jgi:hypothetical protein